METRPMKIHTLTPKLALFISTFMLIPFLFISFITNNFNYTIASVITLLLINLTAYIKILRLKKKKSL